MTPVGVRGLEAEAPRIFDRLPVLPPLCVTSAKRQE